MIVQLTEEQTLKLIYAGKKVTVNRFRFKYTSKFEWRCLCCKKPTFIPYLTDNIAHVYCQDNLECKTFYIKAYTQPNLVELNFFRLMKQEQLANITR